MPNHMLTEITAHAEVIAALLRPYTQEEIDQIDKDYAETCANYKERTGKPWPYPKDDTAGSTIDFGLLVPEPESIFHGGCNGKHPHEKEDGSGYYEHCWNDWNRRNWGTKWNGYDHSVEPLGDRMVNLRFSTAWSHPYPVIEALFKQFPNSTIEVKHADEDLGGGVGWYKLENGEVADVEEFEGYDDKSCEFAAQLRYGMSYEELQKEWEDA